MLAELRMELKTDSPVNSRMASLFHGVLMETIGNEYADSLHISELHPYSQFVTGGDVPVWTVRTLNSEAYKGIIEPMLSPDFSEFELNQKDIKVQIVSKKVTTRTYEDLMKTFNSDETDRTVCIEFESPTAFKRDSSYVFIPDTRLIFGSLMRKNSSASINTSMDDEEALQYITDHSSISDYRLRSTRFPLEGVKIPAFLGEVSIRFHGTDTMARYAKMLLEFGEYSGVGIKCGMGMGSIRIKERE